MTCGHFLGTTFVGLDIPVGRSLADQPIVSPGVMKMPRWISMRRIEIMLGDVSTIIFVQR